jgi:hypothetical protein
MEDMLEAARMREAQLQEALDVLEGDNAALKTLCADAIVGKEAAESESFAAVEVKTSEGYNVTFDSRSPTVY